MRVTPFLASFGLAAALSTLGLPLPRHSSAAPDNTPGMAMLAAYVSSTGELLDGTGAISATRAGTGIYNVVFNRDVTNCTFAPTRSHRTGVSAVGSASASIVLDVTSAVGVRLFAPNGNSIDRPFQLLVFCNQ